MKKITLFFLAWVCTFMIAKAQEFYPSVVSSGGAISKSSGMSLEWTLGEVAVETISAGKKIYTQGFHQPILNVKSFHSPPSIEVVNANSGLKIQLAPNPAQSFINIYVQDEINENHNFTLFDMSGRKILSRQGNGHAYVLRMELSNLASGVYLLDVRNKKGDMIRTFKIVKAD